MFNFSNIHALHFINLLRFPIRQPISQIIISRYGLATLKYFRNLEKDDWKNKKNKIDVNFWNSVKKIRLLQNFLTSNYTGRTFGTPSSMTNFSSNFQIAKLIQNYLQMRDFKTIETIVLINLYNCCLLYTSPSPRDKRQSRMPSSA